MNELHLKALKAGSLAVMALGVMVYVFNYARSIDRTYPPRTFSAEGTVEIDTTPDIATFSAAVVTDGGQDVAALQEKNTEKMNAVNAFLKEQGIENKDLKTTQYSLNPRYSYPTCSGGVCPPATIVGYTLTQTLQVKVRELGKLSTLLSGVVEQGANSVTDIRFVVDDDTAAKNEARKEAIAKAEEKAKSIAQAAGFRLGEVVNVYESADTPPLPYEGGMGGGLDMAKSAVAPTIEPGTQTAQVTMVLTYAIER